MSAKSKWVSIRLLAAMEPEVVDRVAAVLGGRDTLVEYAANTEKELRARGEHELANEWLEEVAACCDLQRDRQS